MTATPTTAGSDLWFDDPATPALRGAQRSLSSLFEQVREVRAVLSLCAAPPGEGERSATTASALEDALVAVETVADGASRALSALERIFNSAW